MCPDDGFILRESPRGEGIDGKQALESAGFEDDDKPVEEEEATPTWPSNSKRGRSASFRWQQ